MEKAFIYGLVDPRDDQLHYVGKSINPTKRYYVHMSKESNVDNRRSRWIRQLKELGLKPVLIVLEETDKEHWEERERYWITHLTNIGCPLTNATEGGIGIKGIPPEVEEARRKKISKSRKGMIFSAEHKKHLSEKKIEFFKNPKSKENLSRHWAHLTDDEISEVWRLSAEGKLTQREIAERFSVPQSTVSEIKNGKRYLYVTGPLGCCVSDPRKARQQEKEKQIDSWIHSGRSVAEIAIELNVSVDRLVYRSFCKS